MLPLRVLPVNDTHIGRLTIRVDHRPTGSAYVYVRRESDKKTWLCKVRTLQGILAPSQQARALDISAVVTCLYHAVAYDYSAVTNAPLELWRREVAFSQPETWTDGDYRLTMRVSVRSSSVALAVPAANTGDPSITIPVVDIADASEDVVFGFNFTPSTQNLDHEPVAPMVKEKRAASVQTIGVAFANACLNWENYKDHDFLRVSLDGISIINDGFRSNRVELTLDILHVKSPALFVLSINSQAVEPDHTTHYQTTPGSDLFHTIAQYDVRVPGKAWLQVTMLMASAPALEGSKLTVREQLLNG